MIVYLLLHNTGEDAESFSSGDESAFDQALHEDEGSNLVDPKPSLLLREPSLLDLHRDAIDRDLFESYTYTGASLRNVAHNLAVSPSLLSLIFLSLFKRSRNFRPFAHIQTLRTESEEQVHAGGHCQ